MKRYSIFVLCFVLLASPAFADIGYISDTLVVTIRDQPRRNGKVLTTVKTAAPLEILETTPKYLRVRTSKGVEGYIQQQYVTQETPKTQQIQLLTEEKTQLQHQLSQLKKSLGDTKDRAKLAPQTKAELTRLKKDYLALKKNSADIIQITRERNDLQQENSDLTARIQQLKEENATYLRTGVIKWFFAGAGVLFLGWLLGKASRKKRRGYM